MYDTVLGRFLSPDNYVQDPYNTQSFNRYGYVWNNPLSYNDPSGEIVWFVVGYIVIKAALNVYQNWDDITAGSGKFSDIRWGKLGGYATIGAGSGALDIYGGPLGTVLGGGFQAFANSMMRGHDLTTTIQNTSLGLINGALARGVSDGLTLLKPSGLLGRETLLNTILTESLKNTISWGVSTFTTETLRSGSLKEGFDAIKHPTDIFTQMVIGGLSGAISHKVNNPAGSNVNEVRPLIESLKLKTNPINPLGTPGLYIPPGFDIPPARNVIPPKTFINLPKNRIKG